MQIQFVETPDIVENASETYLEFRGKSCEEKSWKQSTKKFKFKIPKNLPPAVTTITFCASAHDFADNPGQDCITVTTGQKLRGALKVMHTSQNAKGTEVHQTHADLSLTVNADSSIIGTAHLKFSQHGEGRTSCGTWTQFTEPVEIDLPVSGSVTETGIVFRVTSAAEITSPHKKIGCDGQVDDS